MSRTLHLLAACAKSESDFRGENEKLLHHNYEIIITCSGGRAFITASHFLPRRRSNFTTLDKNHSTMGLMMSSRICNIVAQSNAFTAACFSPLCLKRSIDPASFSSSCLLLPFPSRFSFSARDCNGYDFSFLPTITYARKRIYGIKREHPSLVASKIQDDEQIYLRFASLC